MPIGGAAAARQLGRKQGRKGSNRTPPPPRLSYAAPTSAVAVEEESAALLQDVAGVVSLVQLQTLSAVGQAQFQQRFHLTQSPDWLDEFNCGALEAWELPGSPSTSTLSPMARANPLP